MQPEAATEAAAASQAVPPPVVNHSDVAGEKARKRSGDAGPGRPQCYNACTTRCHNHTASNTNKAITSNPPAATLQPPAPQAPPRQHSALPAHSEISKLPPPTTVINMNFSPARCTVLDPAMESYFVSLVEDSMNDDGDTSTILPFIFANAPSLSKDDNATVSKFIQRLRQSLARQRTLDARADQLRQRNCKTQAES